MMTLGISQVRQNLPKLIDEIDARFERLFITKGGKAKDVLMYAEEFESLAETIASYEDPETMKVIREVGNMNIQDIRKSKKFITLEDLKKKLKIK
ncbi:MAG: type II toxin-antitoxin system Phd/YefM family antitoxin [Patescibacteria group bacterium]